MFLSATTISASVLWSVLPSCSSSIASLTWGEGLLRPPILPPISPPILPLCSPSLFTFPQYCPSIYHLPQYHPSSDLLTPQYRIFVHHLVRYLLIKLLIYSQKENIIIYVQERRGWTTVCSWDWDLCQWRHTATEEVPGASPSTWNNGVRRRRRFLAVFKCIWLKYWLEWLAVRGHYYIFLESKTSC